MSLYPIHNSEVKTSSQQCLRSGSVYGHRGSGSVCQRYGSGSFHHQAKTVKKIFIYTVLWIIYDFLSLKNDVHVPDLVPADQIYRGSGHGSVYGTETLCDTIRYTTTDLLTDLGLVILVKGCDYSQKICIKNQNTKWRRTLKYLFLA